MYLEKEHLRQDEIEHKVNIYMKELQHELHEVMKYNSQSFFLPMMRSLEIAENTIMELRRWLLSLEQAKCYKGRQEDDYTIIIKINPYDIKKLTKEQIDEAIENGTIDRVVLNTLNS